MAYRLHRKKRIDFRKLLYNRLVSLEHVHPGEEFYVVRELPVVVHRRVNIQAVLLAYLVVLLPVPRRGMDYPRARLKRYVLSRQHRREAVKERVPEIKALKRPNHKISMAE